MKILTEKYNHRDWEKALPNSKSAVRQDYSKLYGGHRLQKTDLCAGWGHTRIRSSWGCSMATPQLPDTLSGMGSTGLDELFQLQLQSFCPSVPKGLECYLPSTPARCGPDLCSPCGGHLSGACTPQTPRAGQLKVRHPGQHSPRRLLGPWAGPRRGLGQVLSQGTNSSSGEAKCTQSNMYKDFNKMQKLIYSCTMI